MEQRFQFGQNWSDYSRTIDEEQIRDAEAQLTALLQRPDLNGLTFLDIGCGSGLHALAALRLGAEFVRAVDYDPQSVETTRRLLESAWQGDNYHVEVGDVFTLSSEPQDVVYSWGVLHHTGDMWRAIESASRFVKPSGLFAIALYRKTRLCGFWTWEKRNYVSRGPLFQGAIIGLYVLTLVLRDLFRLKNPVRRFQRGRRRGMHWYYNMIDWIGGYPYESAHPNEVVDFVQRLGFDSVQSIDAKTGELGLLGSGNAQFLFRR